MTISRDWINKLEKLKRFDPTAISGDEKLIYVGNLKNSVVNGKNIFYIYRWEIHNQYFSTHAYSIDIELTDGVHRANNWNVSIEQGDEVKFITLDTFINQYGEHNLVHILSKKALSTYKFTTNKPKPAEKKATTKERKKMKTDVSEIMDANTQAAKVAAQITAGRALNTAVLEKIKPNLPFMVQGYANSSVGPVVAANLVSYAVSTFASDNDKARWAADAMMIAAMADFLDTFNVEKMLAEVLTSVDVTVPEVAE